MSEAIFFVLCRWWSMHDQVARTVSAGKVEIGALSHLSSGLQAAR
jgi:hypothetical protein